MLHVRNTDVIQQSNKQAMNRNCSFKVGGDESLFAASGSHEQDGRHDHIW